MLHYMPDKCFTYPRPQWIYILKYTFWHALFLAVLFLFIILICHTYKEKIYNKGKEVKKYRK